MAGMFRVGVITSLHGVKGAVKVYPTTDELHRFDRLKRVFFSRDEAGEKILGELVISSVQYQKDMIILKFRSLDQPQTAERLKGGSLWIPDEEAIPLSDDEFYIRDYMGAEVYTDHILYGKVTDILETGANFVLEIEKKTGGSILIPVIRDCIVEMDPERHRIEIRLLEGLE